MDKYKSTTPATEPATYRDDLSVLLEICEGITEDFKARQLPFQKSDGYSRLKELVKERHVIELADRGEKMLSSEYILIAAIEKGGTLEDLARKALIALYVMHNAKSLADAAYRAFYARNGSTITDQDDVWSEACEIVCRKAEIYNPKGGAKFTTYIQQPLTFELRKWVSRKVNENICGASDHFYKNIRMIVNYYEKKGIPLDKHLSHEQIEEIAADTGRGIGTIKTYISNFVEYYANSKSFSLNDDSGYAETEERRPLQRHEYERGHETDADAKKLQTPSPEEIYIEEAETRETESIVDRIFSEVNRHEHIILSCISQYGLNEGVKEAAAKISKEDGINFDTKKVKETIKVKIAAKVVYILSQYHLNPDWAKGGMPKIPKQRKPSKEKEMDIIDAAIDPVITLASSFSEATTTI